jgi:hypothetical protein
VQPSEKVLPIGPTVDVYSVSWTAGADTVCSAPRGTGSSTQSAGCGPFTGAADVNGQGVSDSYSGISNTGEQVTFGPESEGEALTYSLSRVFFGAGPCTIGAGSAGIVAIQLRSA